MQNEKSTYVELRKNMFLFKKKKKIDFEILEISFH